MAPDYLAWLADDGTRFSDAVRADQLDAEVPSCPGWTVRDLAHHLGWVQRWARLAAATGAQPQDADIDAPPPPGDGEAPALAAWMDEGCAALIGVLGSVDPEAPTWHPFPVPRVAGVWPRRQAHELAIHRWDIQNAVGAPGTLDPDRCVDYLAEYFELIVPRVIARDGRRPPEGTIGVRLTDRPVAWLVTVGDEVVLAQVGPEGAAPDAALVGTGEDLLLALWGRRSLAQAPADATARAWLEFGGN